MNPKTPFQYAVKKYGIKNFIRTTIKEFDNENDAYEPEKQLVKEDFQIVLIQEKRFICMI